MVEKDFRKIITDLEFENSFKQERLSLSKMIERVILKFLSPQAQLTNYQIVGTWAKNTMLKTDPLAIGIWLKLNQELDLNLKTKVLCNEIESALIYGLSNINQIERNQFQNELKITLEPEIEINLLIQSFNDDSIIKQFRFVELANQEYTYFKNTILVIKYAIDDLKLKTINEELIEVLLYYSLVHYQVENKYYDYLGAFCKGLEDFFSGRKIEVSDMMYDRLLTKDENSIFSNKYIVIDPSNKKVNLAEWLNEINIGDYRRLRKKIGKMLENPKEDKFIFDNSTEVIVDVNPVYNNVSNNYAWSFVVVDKGLFNQGGEYKNEDTQIQTAILKGVFKGLKALEDNGLFKKKIFLQCDYPDILGNHMLSTPENKSRMRTIKNFIDTKKLNIILTKGNIREE